MGLLDNVLSTIDAKKRSVKRGLMDMLDNPSQWAGMQANRIQEDRYGGAENAQAMKQYLTKQPYDPKALTAANDALRNAAINESLGAVVVPKLSKIGDPRDAAGNLKQVIQENGGNMPYQDIAQMTKPEFDTFYEYVAPHHQGKFDRLLRSYAPQYDDLPRTMQDYAQDFKYENPRIVAKLKNVKPEDNVDIFRSVTASDPDTKILPGDWVALERNYAAQHGRLGNDSPRLMKQKVPAKDVRWAGTSADEYFYVPSGQVDSTVGTKYDALKRYVSGLLDQ